MCHGLVLQLPPYKCTSINVGGRWWIVRHTQKSNVSSVVVPFIRNPQKHLHTSYYCYYHAAWRSTWVGTHAPIYRHKPYITGISIKIGARFISPTYLPPSLAHSLTLSIYRAHRPSHSSRLQRMRSSPRHSSIGPPTTPILAFKGQGPTPGMCFIPCERSCQSCVRQWPSCGARCSGMRGAHVTIGAD